MTQPIHASLRGDPHKLHHHLVQEHSLPVDDVPHTVPALEGVHNRIHDGTGVPGATPTHCSERHDDTAPAEPADPRTHANHDQRRATDPAGLPRETGASRAPSAKHVRRADAEGLMSATQLRDLLADLINTDSRYGLRAEPVRTRLSRDRHAIDVTDGHGDRWRVDVHDQSRSGPEVWA